MSVIWSQGIVYRAVDFTDEKDLESAIDEISEELFGPARIYLNVKKKVSKSIPDGYLVDLSGREAELYFVEVELGSHDLFRHMAVQILQFSFAFTDDPWGVKTVLHEALKADTASWQKCADFVARHNLNSVDHLLEGLIQRPFAALVIADRVSEQLESLFSEKLRFPVEVIEVSRYENDRMERFYRFEPFLADVTNDSYGGVAEEYRSSNAIPIDDIDTIVVPAREEGFRDWFLGRNEWRSVKIHASMIPRIKYIAVYQIKPQQAITYIAPVKEITAKDAEPGKYRLVFSEPAKPVGPITLATAGRVKALQSSRYTTRSRLMAARTLDDVWARPAEAAIEDALADVPSRDILP